MDPERNNLDIKKIQGRSTAKKSLRKRFLVEESETRKDSCVYEL